MQIKLTGNKKILMHDYRIHGCSDWIGYGDRTPPLSSRKQTDGEQGAIAAGRGNGNLDYYQGAL